jgi:hypothetical protein
MKLSAKQRVDSTNETVMGLFGTEPGVSAIALKMLRRESSPLHVAGVANVPARTRETTTSAAATMPARFRMAGASRVHEGSLGRGLAGTCNCNSLSAPAWTLGKSPVLLKLLVILFIAFNQQDCALKEPSLLLLVPMGSRRGS